MSDFQHQAIKLAAQQTPLSWLESLRSNAADSWLAQPWPTRKTEHWKYTPMQGLQKTQLQSWGAAANQSECKGVQQDFMPLDAYRLVFVNGVFDTQLSGELPQAIVRFSQADSDQQALIEQYLGAIVEGDRHLFATLNSAWLDDGILLHVPRNQVLDKPVYLVNIITAPAVAVNQRLLVVLEENSRAEVIEHYLSSDNVQDSFANSLTEIHIGDNASLHHYRLNLEQEAAQHIGAVHVDLQRNARLRGFAIALGSRLMRIDYQMNHRGQGAELDLQGVYVPRNQQVVDYHTNICHWVPHCTSNEVFRGIVSDSAQAIFNGRIYIHKDAQKTLAELSNKNLLTSNKAEINTKPELEIYADDVKCAHGATISQLNENARYYLQSRGLSRAEADVMLSFGFINELLEQIAQPVVHDYLQPRLAHLFGRDNSLNIIANAVESSNA
ncbi:Fe-S cluster assembly protein SufD [Cellvibrio sp. pealriver]|uniref:Fe-S cluster assembly protein SufD n=1 Tax=Cellvibrio sp. pealriver TaxID=1622269 RepID=UPI00066FB818|nr:Fe-S cluster assembly protein SufD [Cellvibrio sp. pealriver]